MPEKNGSAIFTTVFEMILKGWGENMRKNGFATTLMGLGVAAFGILGVKGAMGAIPASMHPDFDLSQAGLATPYKTMGMAFLSDGRMILGTTEAIGGGEVPPSS